MSRIVEDLEEFFLNFDYPAGGMFREESLLLYTLVRSLRPRRVLEIGTLYGASAGIIVRAMDEVASAKDKDPAEIEAVEGRLICVDPEPKIKINWDRIAHRATLLRGFSPAAVPKAYELAGGKFDLCLIDGGHGFQQVVADAMGCLPYVEPESYLLFHDAYYPEVRTGIDNVFTRVTGLVDCGIICRWKGIDFTGEYGPKGAPWCGFRLVRVASKIKRRHFRLWGRVVRTLNNRWQSD
jgi:predicted O-methyltransferase YrrM